MTPNSTVEYGPASSNSINIISADSSVVSSLDEDEESANNTSNTNNSKENSKKKSDVDHSIIKREIHVNKAIFTGSSTKINDRDTLQSPFFQNTTGIAPNVKLFNRAQHPQLKSSKLNSVQNEYVNNYYINRQGDFPNGKLDGCTDLQKIVVRPPYSMQFNDHQKTEGKIFSSNCCMV